MKKMRTTKPMPMPMPRPGVIYNLDDTRLCVICFLDDASRFAVASSILKLQPAESEIAVSECENAVSYSEATLLDSERTRNDGV